MAYFPAFVKLDNLRVLLVGGGNVALEKLEKLLDFTDDITIVALEVNEKILSLAKRYHLAVHQRAYVSRDVLGFDIVIVAVDLLSLQREIFEATRTTRILVNSVDNTQYCDFIFPSYIQKGDLTVAFSTGGSSPAFSKKIKEYFEYHIPNSVEGFLKQMKKERKELPKGKSRMLHFEKRVERFFAKYFKFRNS